MGARSPQAGPGPLPVPPPLPVPLPTPLPASPLEASAIILELLRHGYEHRHDAIELPLTGPMRCVLDEVEATAHVEDRRAVNRSTTPLASTRKSMATAYTSSFSWSNGIAASGGDRDRDRDRERDRERGRERGRERDRERVGSGRVGSGRVGSGLWGSRPLSRARSSTPSSLRSQAARQEGPQRSGELRSDVMQTFLEKMIHVLDRGAFTSTYKYAVLLALIDLCVEAGEPPTSVTTQQLAQRVIELYWPQVRAFGEVDLRQSTNKRTEIVSLIANCSARHGDNVSAAMALRNDAFGFAELVREVEWTLIEWPLPRVQKAGNYVDPFIYVINWDERVKRSAFLRGNLRRPGFDNNIRFVSGAAQTLIQLASVLVPLLRSEWTSKVSDLNNLAEAKLASHLFLHDRTRLQPLHGPLRDLQGGRCFYCENPLTAGNASHVDHFIPWSRYADDGLDNLLLAHSSCNLAKSHYLADLDFATRWRDRSLARGAHLDELASVVGWSRNLVRTFGVAASVYQRVPPGVRLWAGGKTWRPVEDVGLDAVRFFGRGLLAHTRSAPAGRHL